MKREVNIDDLLIQQLLQKNKQNVKQQDQINHLQRLLKNRQILTLKAQEQVILLEEKDEKNTKWNF